MSSFSGSTAGFAVNVNNWAELKTMNNGEWLHQNPGGA